MQKKKEQLSPESSGALGNCYWGTHNPSEPSLFDIAPSTFSAAGTKMVSSQVLVAHSCNLATWEAEIRKIKVQGPPRKIDHKMPSPK
jgi:hypothetical protein